MKSQHKTLSKRRVINQRNKQNLQKFILFIIIQQLKELVSNRFGNMKQNQKFGQNLSDGNMAQSVKLDYGSSDFQPNVRKQFMKYAGGQFQATDEPYKPQIILPDTKPIKTQYSLVGELESGFTKLKNNQVQYLKQLRKQFKQIRDLPNTKIKQEQKQKISNSSSHSQSDRNPPNEDDSSSIQSSEKIHKKEINSNQRQQRLWNMQKKQYQYLLNNCQIKIEQLLHNEMQLKKVIHELRSSNLVSKAQPYQAGAKYESQIKQLQKQLREQKQKGYKISNQLQKLKVTNKQINQKYYKLQSESSYKFKDQNKLSDQKRKLQEYLRLEKDKFMNCQIQRRKFQMENQLLTKQKQQQISRIQKQLDHQNAVHELNVKNLIKKFEDQIQLKDRRYNLLISQYQKLKRDHSQTKQKIQTQKHHHHHNQNQNQNNQNQMFQLMKKLIQQKRNPQNQDLARTINKLIQKLQKQPQSDSQSESSSQSSKYQKANHHQQKLLAQIRILKAEIEALRGNSGQGIDLQPMKKMYEAEVAAHKDTIAVLQRKLRDALANKQQSPKPVEKLKPFNRITSQQQIKDLQRRISELEAQRMNMTSKSQNQQLIQKEKKKIQKVQQQLRAQTRKKNEAEFQIFKLRKQLQSRSVMYANEKNYHNNMTQLQLQRANTNIGYWKKEFENMRAFYQQRLRVKNAQLEASLNTTQIENIKKQYANGLQAARQEYQNQTKKLIERLTAYERDYLQYDTLQKRYNALQIAYFQLQRSMVQSRNTSQGVDHLWLIKQTQYGNINQILRQVRMNRQFNLVNPVYSNSGTGASGIIPSLPIIMQNLLGPGYNPRAPNQIPSPSGPNVAGGQIVTYLNNPPLNNSNALNLNSSNAFGGNINPGLNATNPNLLATNVVQQNPPYNSNIPPQNSSYGIPNLNRGSNYGGQSQPLMESQRMSNNFNLQPPPPPPPPPPQVNTMIQRNSQDPYQQRLQNNIFESIRDSRNPANLPRMSVNSNYIPERMSNTSFA